MRILCLLFLTAGCVSCAGPIAAGPYPRGFTIGGRMHYLSPEVADAVYGPNDPIAQGWVVAQGDRIYVSPKLAKKIAEAQRK